MSFDIKKIIREEIKLFFENFEFGDSQKYKSYFPNDAMKNNAKKALEAIASNDLTQSGGNEGNGKSKAKSIVNGEEINHSMLRRMKAFFDNNSSTYQSEKAIGKTINNSGIIQSWNLWGGDEGKNFANRHIDSLNQASLDRKKNRRVVSNGVGTGNVKRLVDTNYHRKK